MQINEIRNHPEKNNYRLVNMNHDGKTYSYYNDGLRETFEIYFNNDGKPENGFYKSASYKKLEKVPRRHHIAFRFLIDEFNKIDWK